MTTLANRFALPISQLVLQTGLPATGYKYKFYLTGGATPASVYTSSDLTGAVTSVTLDAYGKPASDIFLDPAVNYRLVVTDDADTALFTYDNIHDYILATASFARFKLYNGSPNGSVSGIAGSVGGSPADAIFDTSNNIIWVCTTTGTSATAVWTNITATISGSVAFTGIVTPTSFGTQQDDYNPTSLSTASTLRLNPSAACTITGLSGGSSGRQMTLINVGSFNITFDNESTSSSATNRFTIQEGNIVLPPNAVMTLQYDALTARWRLKSPPIIVSPGGPGVFLNGTIVCSVAANALTIALKTQADADPTEADPVTVAFRKTTVTDGTWELVEITAALSLVISSGSRLGFTASEVNLINVGLINNAGTAELCATGDSLMLMSDRMITTVAEGGAGAADSKTVVYSTTARTSVPCRLIAVLLITTGATAGQWGTAPTRVTMVHNDVTRPWKNTVKAMCQITGNGVAINDSMNVSSFTDTSTGDWVVNFATAFANADYAALSHCTEVAGAPRIMNVRDTGQAVGSCPLHCQNTGGAGADSGGTSFIAVGF
jgi:hypothetical protein